MQTIGEVCVGISLDNYRGLLQGFLADEAGSLAALHEALAQVRTGELKALGHAVKGAAASLGLAGVAALARRIETEGAGFDPAQAAAAARELRDSLELAQALTERMGLS